MAVFNEIVEKKVDGARGQLPAELGFETAKRLLAERYGDSYRIIAAYRKEIKH